MGGKGIKKWNAAVEGRKAAAEKKAVDDFFSRPAYGKTDLWSSEKKAPTTGGIQYGSGTTYSVCSHRGDKTVWEGPRGITLSGARASQADEVDADILIDLSGTVSQPPGNHLSGDAELVKMLSPYTGHSRLLRIHWPDYSAPTTLRLQFWLALWAAIPDNARVTVCCLGSHGRTGTALASMILVDSACRLGTALNGFEATALVRERHCKKAVESQPQEKYLTKLAVEAALLAKLVTEEQAKEMAIAAHDAFEAAFRAKGVVVASSQAALDLRPPVDGKRVDIFDLDPIKEKAAGDDLEPITVKAEDVEVVMNAGFELLDEDGLAPSGNLPISCEFFETVDWEKPLAQQGLVEGDVVVTEDGIAEIALAVIEDDEHGKPVEDLELTSCEDLSDDDWRYIDAVRERARQDKASMMLPGWVDPKATD